MIASPLLLQIAGLIISWTLLGNSYKSPAAVIKGISRGQRDWRVESPPDRGLKRRPLQHSSGLHLCRVFTLKDTIEMDCGVFTMNRNHLKRVIRKWRKGSMGYEELSPTYSTASCATPGMNRPNGHPGRCEGKQSSFSKRLIRKNEVTVVVGKERQVFKVDPHILQDRLFQSLLQSPTTRCVNWDQSHTDENRFRDALQTSDKCSADNSGDGVNYSAEGCIVFLDCDAILFEHMLWLVYNDDPSVPHLNLEELMEFYAQEGV